MVDANGNQGIDWGIASRIPSIPGVPLPPGCVAGLWSVDDLPDPDDSGSHAHPDCGCGDWEDGDFDPACQALYRWRPAVLRDHGAHGYGFVRWMSADEIMAVRLVSSVPHARRESDGRVWWVGPVWVPHLGVRLNVGDSLLVEEIWYSLVGWRPEWAGWEIGLTDANDTVSWVDLGTVHEVLG